MDKPGDRREWSEEELRQVVGDVLRRDLLPKYVTPRSVPLSKLTPGGVSGARPADGTPLVYDSTNDVVEPGGFALPSSVGDPDSVFRTNLAGTDAEWALNPYCMLRRTSNISLSHNVWAAVDFQFSWEWPGATTMADLANDKIIIPEDGTYIVGARSRFDHVASTCVAGHRVTLNGSTSVNYAYAIAAVVGGTGFPDSVFTGAEIVYLQENDYLKMDVYSYHTSAGTPGVAAASSAAAIEMWVAKVGAYV